LVYLTSTPIVLHDSHFPELETEVHVKVPFPIQQKLCGVSCGQNVTAGTLSDDHNEQETKNVKSVSVISEHFIF